MNRRFIPLILLIIYGVCREFRPVLPYLNEYLTQRNFTDETLNHEVYPVWTYSYLAFLLPVLLLSDVLGHSLFVLVGSLGAIGTMLSMILAVSVDWLKIMEICYGVVTAFEVSYTSFVFEISKNYEKHQKVASWMRSSVLAGMSISYTVGQILLFINVNLHVHAYVSLAAAVFSFMLICCILLINAKRCSTNSQNRIRCCVADKEILSSGLQKLYTLYRRCYGSSSLLFKWSLFWSIATCIYFQVVNYVQNLWSSVAEESGESNSYNGVVEAVNALIASAASFFVQYVKVNWTLAGDPMLSVVCALKAVLLFIIGRTRRMIVAYVMYIVFCCFYQTASTISIYIIALKTPKEHYGFVFGTNMLFALVLQTILTFAVADKNGFSLSVHKQFIVYAAFHCITAVMYCLTTVRTFYQKWPIALSDFKEPDKIVYLPTTATNSSSDNPNQTVL